MTLALAFARQVRPKSSEMSIECAALTSRFESIPTRSVGSMVNTFGLARLRIGVFGLSAYIAVLRPRQPSVGLTVRRLFVRQNPSIKTRPTSRARASSIAQSTCSTPALANACPLTPASSGVRTLALSRLVLPQLSVPVSNPCSSLGSSGLLDSHVTSSAKIFSNFCRPPASSIHPAFYPIVAPMHPGGLVLR